MALLGTFVSVRYRDNSALVASVFEWLGTCRGVTSTLDAARLARLHRFERNSAGDDKMDVLKRVLGECPERQRGRTVNPLAYAFAGSSPASPTTRSMVENGEDRLTRV